MWSLSLKLSNNPSEIGAKLSPCYRWENRGLWVKNITEDQAANNLQKWDLNPGILIPKWNLLASCLYLKPDYLWAYHLLYPHIWPTGKFWPFYLYICISFILPGHPCCMWHTCTNCGGARGAGVLRAWVRLEMRLGCYLLFVCITLVQMGRE